MVRPLFAIRYSPFAIFLLTKRRSFSCGPICGNVVSVRRCSLKRTFSLTSALATLTFSPCPPPRSCPAPRRSATTKSRAWTAFWGRRRRRSAHGSRASWRVLMRARRSSQPSQPRAGRRADHDPVRERIRQRRTAGAGRRQARAQERVQAHARRFRRSRGRRPGEPRGGSSSLPRPGAKASPRRARSAPTRS